MCYITLNKTIVKLKEKGELLNFLGSLIDHIFRVKNIHGNINLTVQRF
jgi:hypothetical protein